MRWLGATLGWALSVALVAGASWVAINSAGRQVLDQAEIEQASDGDGVFDVASPTLGPAASVTAPSGSPAPTGAGGQSTFSGPVEGSSASVPAGEPGVGSQSTGSAPTTKAAPPRQGSDPVPVTGTATTSAGSMLVECTGNAITSAYVFPAEGWSGSPVRAVNGGARTTFRRRSRSISVFVICDAGRPRFHVDIDDDHDDGDRGDDRD
jgi:hypothetical protein